MKKHVIELDTTEIIKLIVVCNAAIISEEEVLRQLSGIDQTIVENTKRSIEKIWELKNKLKTTLLTNSN